MFSHAITDLWQFFISSLPGIQPSNPGCWKIVGAAAQFRGTYYINWEMLQADSLRDASFGCDWVGTPVPLQRCLMFIIATANKEFKLTAGKFVPVSNVTTLNVCI
jgi:hypothetical protein